MKTWRWILVALFMAAGIWAVAQAVKQMGSKESAKWTSTSQEAAGTP